MTQRHRRHRPPLHLHLRRGALHRRLGIPEDEPIPTGLLRRVKRAARDDGDTRLEREANFALVARKWRKRKNPRASIGSKLMSEAARLRRLEASSPRRTGLTDDQRDAAWDTAELLDRAFDLWADGEVEKAAVTVRMAQRMALRADLPVRIPDL